MLAILCLAAPWLISDPYSNVINNRIFGSFTMETILAIAFGHTSDGKISESDNLVKAVKSLSQQIEEGRMTSFATLIMLISKPLSPIFLVIHSVIAGYFPSWMIPVLRFFFLLSSRSESFRRLNSIVLDLVKCRCESTRKVIIISVRCGWV